MLSQPVLTLSNPTVLTLCPSGHGNHHLDLCRAEGAEVGGACAPGRQGGGSGSRGRCPVTFFPCLYCSTQQHHAHGYHAATSTLLHVHRVLACVAHCAYNLNQLDLGRAPYVLCGVNSTLTQ